MQEGIRALQFPPAHGLPIWRNFEPCGVAFQGIRQRQQKYETRRRGRILKEYRSVPISIEIIVLILEDGDIDVQPLGHQGAITDFSAEQLFRGKILVAEYAQ